MQIGTIVITPLSCLEQWASSQNCLSYSEPDVADIIWGLFDDNVTFDSSHLSNALPTLRIVFYSNWILR